MVQIVTRKKKGRPSKVDLARRNSSTAPSSSAGRGREPRRSRRRRNVRYNFDIDDYVDDDEFYEEEDEDVRRREKKLRLLLDEDDSLTNRRVSHAPASSSSDDYDEDDDDKPLKKRKLEEYDGEVDGEDDEDTEIEEIRGRKVEEEEEEEEAAGRADSGPDLPKAVPLPDKKTLELILDKLQKKDTYGVYAEPVDPEELPDYHNVIKHPMDFATVRKKLAKGTYLTLEQFEIDVLLICTNAMQYNAPDTIYYKQAGSIQELAKRKFERLRANVGRSEMELKPELKTISSLSLPHKQSKRLGVWAAQDAVGSDFSSGATLATTGEFQYGSSTHDTSVRPDSVDGLIAENSSLMDSNLNKGEEFQPGKGFVSRNERKPSMHDENRRATYNISIQPILESESIFSTFEGESKQFIPVGLHADHSYARSVARFAATLGSVAWKVASQRIEQALPEGFKFGRGWVGEYEPLPTPVLMLGNCTVKEPDFLKMFLDTSNAKNDQKASKNPIFGNENAPKNSLHVKELNEMAHHPQKLPVCGNNTRISVKLESPRAASLETRPPFFSSQAKSSEFESQNPRFTKIREPKKEASPQVELNYPPPLHTTPADFVTRRPISNASDIPSPRPAETISRNRNLLSSASFKHPNSKNDAFVSMEPSKGNPIPVKLDCNKTVTSSSSAGPKDKIIPGQQEQQGLSDPVQMMKMLAEKARYQQNYSNGSLIGSQIHSNGSQKGIPPKQEDSNNVALAAAHQWMSIGGAGGFIKPPLTENTNPHYIPPRDCHSSRFRGELPVAGLHFQPEKNGYQETVHAFAQPPVRMTNEPQFQNRHVGFPQLVTADLSRFQVQSNWRGVTPQMQHQSKPKQRESCPPDLNIGYQSMGSPVRQSTAMLLDAQQPDLALQL